MMIGKGEGEKAPRRRQQPALAVSGRRLFSLSPFLISFSFAVSAQADDGPRIELPLGPYVRPGRPLDVRVVGGADHVRAPGTPWALPQGERGDEFLLQPTQETALRLDLTAQGVPVPPAVTAASQIALSGYHLRELRELKHFRQERWLATMLEVERSHVPFPDEPPVEYPSAATLRRRSPMFRT